MIVEPGSIIHDFRIKCLIGSGGMGMVFTIKEESVIKKGSGSKALFIHHSLDMVSISDRTQACACTLS